MDKVFLDILNLSITASYVIICILLIRLPMKKLPKIFSYSLWIVAGVRLVLPFSLKGAFSLFPKNMNTKPIPGDIMLKAIPRVDTGNKAIDNMVAELLPKSNVTASVNPLQIYIMMGAIIWLLGMGLLFGYAIFSLVRLKRKLRFAIEIEKGIYEKEGLTTAFVLGMIKPAIYLPTGLSEEEKKFILLHERTHIRRKDMFVKFLAFCILCLHWFNPLVWIAFYEMTKDMELSCDERVLKEMGGKGKKEYASSLLNLASHSHLSTHSPLAFSEGSVKTRIRNVLKYSKPKWFFVGVSLLVCVVVAIGLLTDGKKEKGGTFRENEKEGSYHYKSERADFIVNIPEGFTLEEDRGHRASEIREASPTEGVYLNVDKENQIYVYSSATGQAYPYETPIKIEGFQTKEGKEANLFIYEDYIHALYGKDSPYGAITYFKDKALFLEKKEVIMEVFKSVSFSESDSEEGMVDRRTRLRKEKARYSTMNGKEMGEEIEKLYKDGEIRAGFIRIEGDNLYFDEVEMIERDDKERIKRLGLDEERDLITGYYIHNEEVAEEVFKITEDSFYYFTDLETYFVEKDADNRGYVTDDEEELIKHFGGKSPRYPVFIENYNWKLRRIIEKFSYTI